MLTGGAGTGAQLELASLHALGVNTVTVAIGFPILYQPFDAFDYQGYLSFYKQLAVNIHAAGMKMVVETGVVDVPGYCPTLADPMYLAGRAQQILTIAREIQPDYLVIAEEPDTEAETTGKPFIATVPGFSSMVDIFLSQLNSAGFTTTNVGAGVGTWIDNAQGYIQALAAKSRLSFIDLHVYPVDRTFLTDTITLIDLAQSAGKPVTMCEAWLEKRREAEFTGVAVTTNDSISARDPFSFWAPLDQQFLTAFAKLAWWKQLKVFSPFWSGYFHAYLSAYDSIAPDQILADASAVASTAIMNGQYTSTGLAYQSVVSATAVSAASFVPGPVAPDSMVSIFGIALAPSTVTGPIPLQTSLAGTTVTFTDSAGAAAAIVVRTGIRGRNALTDVQVSVGGVLVTPQYAGAQPQYPGMDQVNILLPPALAGRGALTIDLSVAGQHANPVAINVK